jgi:3-hydroxyisobutyrate dehydrogenase-like beta-hydroxyacid dehydrogenase
MSVTAFLGLGVMGFPMAGHLVAAGHEVRVWNRTAAKAEDWAGRHAGAAHTAIEEAVERRRFVMMCLGDDPDVRVVADRPFRP